MKFDLMYLPVSIMFVIGMYIGYYESPPKEIESDNVMGIDTIRIVDTVYIHTIGHASDIPSHVDNYINRFLSTAQREQEIYGIPASIKLAQAMLETGFGRSYVATNAKNHFGIKSRNWDGPISEYVIGHVDAMDDCYGYCKFQKFKTDWASWRAHSIILQNERYSRLRGVTDYEEYANGLQECGYATANDYAKNLISIINKYRLYVYDCDIC